MVTKEEGEEEEERRRHHHQVRAWALRTWVLRVLLWTALIQLTPIVWLWRPPRLHKSWPSSCFHGLPAAINLSSASPPLLPPRSESPLLRGSPPLPPPPNASIKVCDMVTNARYLNLTLLVPELDKVSFWADPSEFEDIFDLEHFVGFLRDEVRIIKALPKKFNRKIHVMPFSMLPVSWSNEKYYLRQVLPLFCKHKFVHFNKTDTRLANNGLPLELQRLRCRVNYEASRFTPQLQAFGNKLITNLKRGGPFVVLHLRCEMDMLSFSGCTRRCSKRKSSNLLE